MQWVEGGTMTWTQAMDWAANLSYYDSVRGVTYDDWRLPAVAPVNGVSFNYNHSRDGSTDYGFNIGAPGSAYPGNTVSELAYMFYVNLGLKGLYHPDGSYNPYPSTQDYIVSEGGQADVGLVKHLQGYSVYWSGVEIPQDGAWSFRMGYGDQISGSKSSYEYDWGVGYYAWAVRPGDVAAVPEADTWAMLLAGLGLVGVAFRRRRG